MLSIDPGSSKCGLAVVKRAEARRLEMLHRAVVPVEDMESAIQLILDTLPISMIIVGSGTGSKPVIHLLRERFATLGLLEVDEKDTTRQARERYWEHNKRPWYRKLFPSSLQVPSVPIDDYAAFVLAERVLLEA